MRFFHQILFSFLLTGSLVAQPAPDFTVTDTDGNVHHLKVQYPHSILDTAKKNGIVLPYSCEAGKCGSCAATCIQGKVWMMYNEVLLNDEIRKGLVLTCSGYPVGGDVILSY